MKNKKGNIVVIATIVVIVAITIGVFGWMFGRNNKSSEKSDFKNEAVDKAMGVEKKSDARKILYACDSLDGGQSNYCLIDENGSNKKRLNIEEISANENAFAFSSLSDKIVYTSIEKQDAEGTPYVMGLRIYDIKSEKSSLIKENNYTYGFGVSDFSPDGKRFIYSVVTSSKVEVFLFDVYSLKSEKMFEYAYGVENSWTLDWSPDGRHILFAYDGDIYVSDLKGETKKVLELGVYEAEDMGGEKTIVSNLYSQQFDDSGLILYKKINNPNFFSVNIDGENNKQLTSIKEPEDKYMNILGFTNYQSEALVLYSWPKGQEPTNTMLSIYNIKNGSERIIADERQNLSNVFLSPDRKKFAAMALGEGMSIFDLNGKKLVDLDGYSIIDWK